MASDRPPGRPLSWLAYWLSSISVPICAPAVSSPPRPPPVVVARMLFISSCMNSASNWRAVSRTAAFGSAAARLRSASSERASKARRLSSGPTAMS